ncbi:hypothetical protein ACH5RR_029546 [Cinchona calisaya]|uniref:Thioredoxin domain-containing protein n=1 Tax=Cinchona calisaya TaxID=153742 RepID=A0ABD2YVT7_9GENT
MRNSKKPPPPPPPQTPRHSNNGNDTHPPSLFQFLFLLLLLLLYHSIRTVHSAASGDNGGRRKAVEWQILTKINYSSEIHRHPNLLLMITVPWCGESRSLGRELANVVTTEQERFGTLKLTLLYRNSERMLANALGASEGITIIYIHHSLSYKYGGRLRVQNILSSVHHVMSLLPEQLPLKLLRTPHELMNFLGSTDKALLLLDFCGWTPRLLAKGVSEETNGTLTQEESQQVEGMQDLKMSCSVENEFYHFPWFTEHNLESDGILSEADNITHRDGFSCNSDELQRLKSFLPKFMKVARDFFLPPERLGFGLVAERSLLSELDIEASAAPWLMKLYAAGCPICSKVVTEGDDLKMVLQTQESVITELTEDAYDVPTLPANRASILLFIDRSSDSLSIRKESKEALDAFRQLALHHHISNHTSRESNTEVNSSHETYQVFSTSRTPRFELFPELQKLNMKDKMSVTIMNDRKQISVEKFISDLQGSSLHEILENLLKQKKELKLSSLAKDAGFQLLSEDFEIKAAGALPAQPKLQSNQVLEFSQKDDLEGTFDQDKDLKPQSPVTFKQEIDEESKLTDAASSQAVHEKDPTGKSKESSAIQFHTTKGVGYAQDRTSEEERLAGVHDQMQQKEFRGSFFFCDGHFRLLKAFTASSSKVPSVVIIDPIKQKHFILPETAALSYSLISDFLDGFLNGSLPSYQQSETVVHRTREAPVPPFVNLDFHEAESIPRVTAHTFSELVLGNQSDSKHNGNPWDRDVLILLSNSWCGICQRMEMVVREVFRAINGYEKVLKNGSSSKNSLLTKGERRKM